MNLFFKSQLVYQNDIADISQFPKHIFRFSNLKISSNLMEGQWMPRRDIELQNRSKSFQHQSPSHHTSHSAQEKKKYIYLS